MTSHDHLFDGIQTSHAYVTGLILSIVAVAGANTTMHIDVLDWVPFSIGNIDFPVRSILTIFGSISGLTIAVLGVKRQLDKVKANDPGAA